MKANAMLATDGSWRDVAKQPATDPGKGSKAGRQAVVRENGRLVAARRDAIDPARDELVPVWRDGALLVRRDFADVRARAEQG